MPILLSTARRRISIIGGVILLSFALIGGVAAYFLSQENQDTRQQASGGSCWCTGQNQCQAGWNWGGGENYCATGLKCCTQGGSEVAEKPAPADTTKSQTCASGWTCNGHCADAAAVTIFTNTWSDGHARWLWEAAGNSASCGGNESSPRTAGSGSGSGSAGGGTGDTGVTNVNLCDTTATTASACRNVAPGTNVGPCVCQRTTGTACACVSQTTCAGVGGSCVDSADRTCASIGRSVANGGAGCTGAQICCGGAVTTGGAGTGTVGGSGGGTTTTPVKTTPPTDDIKIVLAPTPTPKTTPKITPTPKPVETDISTAASKCVTHADCAVGYTCGSGFCKAVEVNTTNTSATTIAIKPTTTPKPTPKPTSIITTSPLAAISEGKPARTVLRVNADNLSPEGGACLLSDECSVGLACRSQRCIPISLVEQFDREARLQTPQLQAGEACAVGRCMCVSGPATGNVIYNGDRCRDGQNSPEYYAYLRQQEEARVRELSSTERLVTDYVMSNAEYYRNVGATGQCGTGDPACNYLLTASQLNQRGNANVLEYAGAAAPLGVTIGGAAALGTAVAVYAPALAFDCVVGGCETVVGAVNMAYVTTSIKVGGALYTLGSTPQVQSALADLNLLGRQTFSLGPVQFTGNQVAGNVLGGVGAIANFASSSSTGVNPADMQAFGDAAGVILANMAYAPSTAAGAVTIGGAVQTISGISDFISAGTFLTGTNHPVLQFGGSLSPFGVAAAFLEP